MKKILCFGDSNTFGYNPKNGKRYNSEIRWSGIVKNALIKNYEVIEAGCNNRTAFCNNPEGNEYTGTKALKKYIANDIDILILQIGINDLQKFYGINISDYYTGIESLIEIARNANENINIILVSPSEINENILKCHFSLMFDEESIKKSKELQNTYKEIAEKYNCKFINLNEITKVSNIDGLHYLEEEHKKIASVILNTIWNLYFNVIIVLWFLNEVS